MFSDNLKSKRKAKGLSQESLASQLHIVRQTVSKWEKGLSVPDAEMLIILAETLDTSVAALLGGSSMEETQSDNNLISQQLEHLNTVLAEKNRRSRRIWKIVAGVLIAFVALTLIIIVLNIAAPPR